VKIRIVNSKIATFVIFLLIICLAPGHVAFGAMGKIETFRFSDMAQDLISLDGGASSDGIPEAHFTAAIKGIGALSNVEIKALTTGQVWNRSSRNMLIQDSKGETIMKPLLKQKQRLMDAPNCLSPLKFLLHLEKPLR